MFWTIIGILVGLWIIGLVLDIIGGLIHILLVLAIIFLIFRIGQWFGRK